MTTVSERLLRKSTRDESGCIVWGGAINSSGYGCIGYDGKVQLTHRVSYTINVGPIAEGQEIDHLCRNQLCIRPDHLEAVTRGQHARRSLKANKTHCDSGHPLFGENLAWRTRANGQQHRVCRECKRQANRAHMQRARAA